MVEANMVEVVKPSEYYAAMTILEDYITVSEFAKRVGVIFRFSEVHSVYKQKQRPGYDSADSCRKTPVC